MRRSNVSRRTLSVHKEHELLLALELAGMTNEDAQIVIGCKDNELAHALLNTIRDEEYSGFPFETNLAPNADFIEGPKVPEGATFDRLKIVSVLKKSEQWLWGDEFAKRAESLSRGKAAGQHAAEFLLRNRGKISEEHEWTEFVFPGTRYILQNGEILIPHIAKWHSDLQMGLYTLYDPTRPECGKYYAREKIVVFK